MSDDRKDIDAALEIEGGLSGWEIDFLESIDKQEAAGRVLTEKQREKLDDILRRFDR